MIVQCKPQEAKEEAKYKLLDWKNYNDWKKCNGEILFDKINQLSEKCNCYFWDTECYVEIELYESANLWTYTHYGNDSIFQVLQKQSENFVDITNDLGKQNIIESDIWGLAIKNIPKGIYRFKVKKRYQVFTEWYFEKSNLQIFLIKQNNDYYAIKSNFYRLGQASNEEQLVEWYEKYGVDDPNAIMTPITHQEISMSKNDRDIWTTDRPIDFNKISDNIELIDNDDSKIIKYGCKTYRIYDLLEDEFQFTMSEDKEE